MILHSKSHTIEAFQFLGKETKPLKWFTDAYAKGKVVYIDNAKELCVIIRNHRGDQKADYGDWVCRNSAGTMFVLSPNELEADFETA